MVISKLLMSYFKCPINVKIQNSNAKTSSFPFGFCHLGLICHLEFDIATVPGTVYITYALVPYALCAWTFDVTLAAWPLTLAPYLSGLSLLMFLSAESSRTFKRLGWTGLTRNALAPAAMASLRTSALCHEVIMIV